MPRRRPDILFRRQVEREEYDVARAAQLDLDFIKESLKKPGDYTAGIDIVARDIVTKKDLPRESLIGIMKEAVGLFNINAPDVNKYVAERLIDLIRFSPDRTVRAREASVVSHALQQKYLPRNQEGLADYEVLAKFVARRQAFKALSEAPNVTNPKEKGVKRIARILLNEASGLNVMNHLYDQDKSTPRASVIQEIAEVTGRYKPHESPSTSPPKNLETFFQDVLVRLPPGKLPDAEKVKRYYELTGRPLPVYISLEHPSQDFVTVQLSRSSSSRLNKYRLELEENVITREKYDKLVKSAAWAAAKQIRKDNPQQFKRILNDIRKQNYIIQVRHATQQDKPKNQQGQLGQGSGQTVGQEAQLSLDF